MATPPSDFNKKKSAFEQSSAQAERQPQTEQAGHARSMTGLRLPSSVRENRGSTIVQSIAKNYDSLATPNNGVLRGKSSLNRSNGHALHTRMATHHHAASNGSQSANGQLQPGSLSNGSPSRSPNVPINGVTSGHLGSKPANGMPESKPKAEAGTRADTRERARVGAGTGTGARARIEGKTQEEALAGANNGSPASSKQGVPNTSGSHRPQTANGKNGSSFGVSQKAGDNSNNAFFKEDLYMGGGNIHIGPKYDMMSPEDPDSSLSRLKRGETLPPWNFPIKDIEFVPRVSLSEQLNKITTENNTMIACIGMGGTGKTQLALNYARNSKFKLKVWFSAENINKLEESFHNFAIFFGLKELKPNREQSIAHIKQVLSVHSDWLLVFDNVEQFAYVKEFLPDGGHIIFTSRYQQWPQTVQTISIDVMKPLEAISLLSTYFKGEIKEKEDASELVQELGLLPLAIAQAGAYIRESGKSISTYLKEYRENKKSLLDNDSSAGDKSTKESLSNTIELSLNKMLENAPKETSGIAIDNTHFVTILTICSYLYSEKIPRQVLLKCFIILYPHLSNENKAELVFDKCITLLIRYSLLNKSSNESVVDSKEHHDAEEITGYSIHRLVQVVIRNMHQNYNKDTKWLGLLNVLAKVLHLEYDSAVNPQKKEICARTLLPHLQMLSSFYANFTSPAKSTQKLFNELLTDIVVILIHYHDNLKGAKNYYNQAIAIRNSMYAGSFNKAFARKLFKFGTRICRSMKDSFLGKFFQGRAIEMNETIHGRDHVQIAISLGNLCDTYETIIEDPRQTIDIIEIALKIRMTELGDTHEQVAGNYCTLGKVYCKFGKYEKALSAFDKSIEIHKKNFGSEYHLPIADVYFEKAKVYGYKKVYSKMIKSLEDCLNIKYQFYDVNHEKIKSVLSALQEAKLKKSQISHAAPKERKSDEVPTNGALVFRNQKQSPSQVHPSNSSRKSGMAAVFATISYGIDQEQRKSYKKNIS